MNNSVLEEKVRERKLLDAFFDEDMMQWSKGMLQKYNKLMAYYRYAMMEVETKFRVLNEELSLEYDRNLSKPLRRDSNLLRALAISLLI